MDRLVAGSGNARKALALAALGVGALLLLLSILAWWDFSLLLRGGGQSNNDAYVLIGRQVTEQNMAAAADKGFSAAAVAALKAQPQVLDAGEVVPAMFPVYATIGGNLALATELPLEAVPDRFIDSLPANWGWQPGSATVPIILSSQFLDIYNYVFAPGQGLPQLSRQSVKAIGLRLQAGGGHGSTYTAYVAGFSDRIGSVLVPQSFIAYGNKLFAGGEALPARLVLRVRDPSDPGFVNFLASHGYTTNPQGLQWSRLRTVVAGVATASGLVALLILLVSTMVYVLYIELTVVNARTSLQLLHQLGYSMRSLRVYVSRRMLPQQLLVLLAAAALCSGIQFIVSSVAAQHNIVLSPLPGWPVWVIFLLCSSILPMVTVVAIRRVVKC